MSKHITIIGAGPVGCLLSVYLAKRGHSISIFERRPDMRSNTMSAGRSINLALSDRGLRGLEAAGIVDDILSVAIPMHGRMMHAVDGAQQYQPYGKEGQAINSVSRGGINTALLECADGFEHVNITFNARCTHVDIETATAHFMHQDGTSSIIESDCIIATDGAYSAVREVLQKTDRFNYQQFYIEHGYKELHIPADMSGAFKMEKHALHIWPRKHYMMIALPNMDGSFTCTLFFPFEGNPSFASLQTDEQIMSFFAEQFPDAMEMMPTLLEDFRTNPVSSLVTVKAFPWAYKDKILLMGDAAHAIVPFFGQGMNAGFEDCRVFDEMLDSHTSDDWTSLFHAYELARKPNGDAIAELALNNFIEMRDLVADPEFLRRKKAERMLSDMFPDTFHTAYSMVTFNHMPYAEALRRGKLNDSIIDAMLEIPGILESDAEQHKAELESLKQRYQELIKTS
ncbi:MAG: FAD-dependent oxidoreductase [Bacteroidota bacterium]